MPKYPPPHPILKQPQLTFLPIWQVTQGRGSSVLRRSQITYVSIHFNITSRSALQPQNTAQYSFVVLLFREGFLLLGYTACLDNSYVYSNSYLHTALSYAVLLLY